METNDRAVALYRRIGLIPTGTTMAYVGQSRGDGM
jgi:ribosomal protein S18 acetylase RimI-like enzyme